MVYKYHNIEISKIFQESTHLSREMKNTQSNIDTDKT